MSVLIRSFVDQDYAEWAALESLVHDDVITAADVRWHVEHRDPRCKLERWVAIQRGELIGACHVGHMGGSYHPDKYEIYVMVAPAHRGQGIGHNLYEAVSAQLRRFDALSATSSTREDWAVGNQFLQKRGFVEAMRTWESHLELAGYTGAPYRDTPALVAELGYEIKPLSELAADPEYKQKLFALTDEVRWDAPSTDPRSPLIYDVWVQKLDDPHFYPEGHMIALKDGEWVGMSALWKGDEEGVITTGWTAVKQAHRSTGVTKALKVRSLDRAKADGFKRVKTWNESNNVRMLAINLKLGFVQRPAWIAYRLACRLEM